MDSDMLKSIWGSVKTGTGYVYKGTKKLSIATYNTVTDSEFTGKIVENVKYVGQKTKDGLIYAKDSKVGKTITKPISKAYKKSKEIITGKKDKQDQFEYKQNNLETLENLETLNEQNENLLQNNGN